MSAAASLVFADTNDAEFIRSFMQMYPELPIYLALTRGAPGTIQGPRISAFRELVTPAIVWVGVPAKWVETKLYKGHPSQCIFVGAGTKFVKVKNTEAVRKAVDGALVKQAEQEAAVEQATAAAIEEHREKHRRRPFGEEPPWYVPDWLL